MAGRLAGAAATEPAGVGPHRARVTTNAVAETVALGERLGALAMAGMIQELKKEGLSVLLSEQISGGGHERGMRSGTLNVPGIVGLGKAAELCRLEMAADTERLSKLRDRLNAGLHKNLDELYVNGSMEHRLPHSLNISFAYVEGESLLMGINDVAVSSGSACTSASLEPSYVLRALGRNDELAHSSIRFTLGRFTTQADIDFAVKLIRERIGKLREMSPLWEMYKEGIDLNTVQWAAH